MLERGPSSEYVSYFDSGWRPLKEESRGKVLLPVLGDRYGRINLSLGDEGYQLPCL